MPDIMMEILFLVPDINAASARYRVRQFLPLLEREGVGFEVREIPHALSSRAELFRSARRAETVFLHRKLFQPWEVVFLRRRARRIIFDFDDAILYRDRERKGYESLWRKVQFRRIIRAADIVIAGNSFLAGLAREVDADKDVQVLPTAIDVNRYPCKESFREDKVLLGWIGSRSTLPYLNYIRPALEEVGLSRKGISLKVVADAEFQLRTLQVENRRWSERSEVEEILSFDIGLAPLPDNPWTRGKCGLKVLQYQAAGLPVICSPVGANREMVEDGRSGVWADDQDGWVKAILKLSAESDLRRKMGRAGRLNVENRYSVESIWPAFKKIVLVER